MPFEKKTGKYRMNPHVARAADAKPAPAMPKAPPIPPMAAGPTGGAPAPEDEPHAKIFDHGDGTGHTEMADGSYHDHQNIEELKKSLEQFFTEEEQEGGPEEAAEQPPPPPSGNPLHGM